MMMRANCDMLNLLEREELFLLKGDKFKEVAALHIVCMGYVRMNGH